MSTKTLKRAIDAILNTRDSDAKEWARSVSRGRSKSELEKIIRDKYESARASEEASKSMSKGGADPIVKRTWLSDASFHKEGAQELEKILRERESWENQMSRTPGVAFSFTSQGTYVATANGKEVGRYRP